MKKPLLVILISFFYCNLVAQSFSDPNFTVSTIVSGFTEPVGAVFSKDGEKLFVWEKAGFVYVCNKSGSNYVKQTTPVIDLTAEVLNWRDHGLMGFALDPDFVSNGYIYLLYIVDRRFLMNDNSITADAGHDATIARLTKYRIINSGGNSVADAASRTILIGESPSTGIPVLHESHVIGSLAFAADGTLLISTGDAASYYLMDAGSDSDTYWGKAISDGIIRSAENVGAFRSQILNSHNGKLLRIDPNTGNGLSSNPFYSAAQPRSAKSRVWAMGFRNPFRILIRPGTGSINPSAGDIGEVYVGDVGWSTWEEFTIVTGPGMNAGWPIYEGHEINSQYNTRAATLQNLDEPNPLSGCTRPNFTFRELIKDPTADENKTIYNPCNSSVAIGTGPRYVHRRPAIDYRHEVTSSRVPIFSGNNAAIAEIGTAASGVVGTPFAGNCALSGVWYTGDNFPPEYKNSFLLVDETARWIKRFTIDYTDVITRVDNLVMVFANITNLAENPLDGTLAAVDITNNSVRKIQYGGNQPPVSVPKANVTYGVSPLTVNFTGNTSYDLSPGGSIASYSWNFGGGTPATSTAANPTGIVFTNTAGVPKKFVVKLTVTDNGGATDVDSVIVSVNNTPPRVNITSPVKNSTYQLGGDAVYNCTATVNDDEHSGSNLKYEWQTILRHNNHEHPEAIDNNVSTTTRISRIGCNGDTYYWLVRLTVTDAAGLVGVDSSKIFPDCGSDNIPPIVTSINPANGATGVSVSPAVSANFNEAIDPSTVTTTTFQLKDAANNIVAAPVSTSSNQITLTPSSSLFGSTVYTATIKGGSSGVKDLAGNPLAGDYSWSFTTVAIDNIPPTVTSVLPVNGATGVSTSTTVTANFNEAVNASTVTSSTFQLRNSSNTLITATVNTSGNQIILTPSAALAGSTVYTATITGGTSGVKDLAGNALANDYNWSFTTAAVDITPPTVTSVSPVNGATGVSTGTTVIANFSEAINASTVTGSTVQLRDAANNLVSTTINTSGSQVTLTPSAALTGSTVYTATITGGTSGVKDLAGNALASNYSWSFTTTAVDNTAPTVSSVSPVSGATGVSTSTTVTASFSEAINASTVTTSTFQLRNSSNTLITATVNTSGNQIILTPSSALTGATVYTATITGGTSGVKDLAGNALASNYSWSFTTAGTAPPANPVTIQSSNTKTGTATTTHSLTGVPAGALLVLSTTADAVVSNCIVTSSPTLTWTKRVDAGATNSDNAEIWTAVYTAGGTISVSSNWGAGNSQASVCYIVLNAEPTLNGAFGTATLQTAPSVTITTTRENSIIFGCTADWRAISGTTRTLRDGAAESLYYKDGNFTTYHYTKAAAAIAAYTLGVSAPTGQQASTSLLEIRGNATTANVSPTVTTQPVAQVRCAGANASFISGASGTPAPTVQWQESTNGTTWTNITGATNGTLTFATTTADNNKQYRAVWTNSVSSVNSNPATLAVNPIPVLSSSLTGSATTGSAFTYTPTSATTGTTFTWTRAVVSGISNTAGSGTGTINETLVNTTASSINVTYVYTLTANGCTNTQNVVVTVSTGVVSPTVTTQPAAQTRCAGVSVSFTSAASGNPAPTVQWQQSTNGTTWTNITGATSGTLTFVTTIADDNKQYRAVWTNSGSSVNSNPATLTVNPIPVLSSGLTSAAASSIAFTYTPTSATTGTTFTWTRAAVTGISNPAGSGTGAINETLVNTTTGSVNVTYVYTLTANGCTNTQNVVVTVSTEIVSPTVTTQPTAQTRCAGANASFTSAASGAPAPTVQWQQSTNGTTWTNITGATSGTLTFATTIADDNKQYRAAWTNSGATVNSNPAILTVNPIPVLSSSLTPNATTGSLFTYTPTSATAGTTFTWARAAVTGISNAAGSGTGTINETLVNTTALPVNVTYVYTLTANGCTNTQNVIVTVSTDGGVVSPTVTAQPSSQTRCEGISVSFTSAASGNPVPTVQWQVSIDGTTWANITGATNSTLSFITTIADNNKQYQAIWTNSEGSVNSDPAALTVNSNPSPPSVSVSDNCGSSLLTAGAYSGSLLWSTGATTESITVTAGGTYYVTQKVNNCTSTAGSDIAAPKTVPVLSSSLTGNATTGSAFTYTPTSLTTGTTFTWTRAVVTGITNAAGNGTGTINETLVNTTVLPVNVTYVYTLTANGCTNTQNVIVTVSTDGGVVSPTVTAQPSSQTRCEGMSVSFTSAASGSPVPTVQWQVSIDGTTWANITGATNSTLSFITTIADNNKQYQAIWTNSEGSVNSNPAILTVNPIPVLSSSLAANATTGSLFTYTPTSITTGTTFTWTRAAVTGISNVAGSGTGAISETLVNTTALPVDVTYVYTLTANGCTNTQNVAVTISTDGGFVSPTVTIQPTSQAKCAGTNASFTSAASGNPMPTVQWQQSTNGGTTWTNITGATSATLTFVTTTADDNKQYRAVWTNSEGPANSNPATLTVNPIPVLSSSLTASATSGTAFSYTPTSVTTGTTFTWTRATVTGISNTAGSGTGATNETLVNTTTATVNVTYVYILTANGCTNTQNVVVAVSAGVVSPTVTTQPVAQTRCAGTNASFTSAATGTPAPTVQWQQSTNGGTTWTNITGATAATLTFATTTADNNKRYRAAWTNSGATVNSNAAILTVNPIPVLSSSLTGTATSGTAFTYTPTSATTGTTFTWTRAAVTGISNTAGSGTGTINETLTNTTNAAVNVTYVYTLTANGCTNTQNLVVTVNPVSTVNCVINGSITSSFTSTTIPAGRYIWFNSSFNPGSLGSGTTPVTINITNAVITFTANSVQYTLNVPNSRVRYDASVTSATTQFINNAWETVIPRSYSGYVFMSGLSYQVLTSLPGSISNINWTAKITIDRANTSLTWRWGAAVYTTFTTTHSGLNIKPKNGSTQNPYNNNNNAGTPENYKSFLVSGAKGSGGTNYTGNFSSTSTATCTLTTAQRSAAQPLITQTDFNLRRLPAEINIDELTRRSLEINVIPNPSNSLFNLLIKGGNRIPVRIRITDVFGKEVERYEKINGNSTLQIGSRLKGGTYFVEVIQGDQRKILKIIKIN